MPVAGVGQAQATVVAQASPALQASFAALPADHAAADLWAPMDDGPAHAGEERHAASG